MTAGWRRWLRIWRRTPEADVDAELRFHLQARAEDLVSRGLAPDAARAQAVAEFGDVNAARAALTEIDRRIARRHARAGWWEGIAQDLRHTLRGLARSPGFTVMVVVTLALGIGANAAVFAVLNRLFLQAPSGVAHADQVRSFEIRAHSSHGGAEYRRTVMSYPEFHGVELAAPEVPVAGFSAEQVHLGSGPAAPTINAEFVAGDYFGVLGVRAEHGRLFRPDELKIGAPSPVAVISDALWRTRLGGSPRIVGQEIAIGVHRYTVIGVAARDFHGTDLDATDVWLPLNSQGSWEPGGFSLLKSDRTGFIQALARVSGSAAAARVIAQATPVFRKSAMARDSLATASLQSMSGAPLEFATQQGAIATRLAGVAAIILLLACANVANLLLTRSMRRRREIALRLALGVSRGRLAMQLLAESAVVAALAGVAALFAAAWGGTALRHALLPNIEWAAPAVNGRVAAFTAVTAAFTALAAGLVPALQATHPDLNSALKSGGLDGSLHRSRTRAALMVAQAALSVVLLAGAGLFVRSLQAVKGIDVGYDTARTILAGANYDVDAAPMDRTARSQLLARVADRLRHAPGVAAVGMAVNPPMQSISFVSVFLPDRDSVPSLDGMPPLAQFVSPGFFDAAGIRVLAGRGFTDADRDGAEPVVVVSESMATTVWPHEPAVGKCVILDNRSDVCRRVVGVVTDEHVVNLVERPAMHFFVPLAQWPQWGGPGEIVIGAAPGRVDAVVAEARRAIAQTFGDGVIPDVRAMRDILAPQLRPWRLGALLFSAAGLLALVVAAIGVYSGISYGVSLRTREIGIRLALGAREESIARLVLAQGVRLVAAGVVLGTITALALGRLVASVLYGVTPHDPAVLGGTAAILLVAAALACLIPARRAARVDPMETLRAE